MKKECYRVRGMALGLSVMVIASALQPMTAYAESPMWPVTDETAYVTLHYDGSVDKVSIVKACDRNKNTRIVDYGEYERVKNMTTLDEADSLEDGVAWNLPEDMENRFYYEVFPKDNQMDIPWDVRVSYTLNGRPEDPKELAGKAGLVGIDVAVTPNADCKQYYRDNFILMAGMIIDTEENDSFSAPGSQFQTIGTYQAAFFTAMPKQEEEFHFTIGSESFETQGLMIMMMPATMSQMDDIGEINEHKDNIEDASSAMSTIIDDILAMMSGMSGAMVQTADGMDQVDEGRQIISNYDGAADETIDEMLASFAEMERSLGEFSEVIGETRMADHISLMGTKLKDGLGEMDDMVDHMSSAADSIGKIKKLMTQLEHATPEEQGAIIEEIRTEVHNLNAVLRTINNDGSDNSIQDTLKDLEDILDELEEMGEEDQAEIRDDTRNTDTEIIRNTAISMAESLEKAGKQMNASIEDMDDMVDEMEEMADVLGMLADDMRPLLDETKQMMDAARVTMHSMSDAVILMDSMMDQAGPYMDNGMHLTLNGMSAVMRKMADAVKKTEEIQSNKDILTDVIQDEWNRLDDDLGILDIDTSAEKISFTSEKNPSPRSLQIIMRTEEIKIADTAAAEGITTEKTEENRNIWDRIRLIFVKIGETLTSLFS